MPFAWSGEDLLRPHLQVVRGVLSAMVPARSDALILNLKKILVDSGSKLLRPSLVLIGGLAALQRSRPNINPVPRVTGNEAFIHGTHLVQDQEESIPDPSDDECLDQGWFPPRVYRLAAAVELLHTASLIHDDILDNAQVRRGLPTLHAHGEYRRAVLSGDYLLSAAFLLMSKDAQQASAVEAARGIHLLLRGEMLQHRRQDLAETSHRDYLRQIAGKTALLFIMSLRGGAAVVSPTDNLDLQHSLGRWAYRIGMAFQIQDDILDYRLHLPNSPKPNKSAFRDYSQGLITLPLILAHEHPDYREKLAKWCRKHPPGRTLSRGKQKFLRTLILNAGGFARTETTAASYTRQARLCIENGPMSPSIRSLLDALGTALLNRTE